MRVNQTRRIHVFALNEIIEANILLSLAEFVGKIAKQSTVIESDVRKKLTPLLTQEAAQSISDYRQGKIDSDDFAAELNGIFSEHFGVELDSEIFWQCWNAMLVGVLKDAENIKQKLTVFKEKVVGKNEKCFIVSETNPAHMEVLINFCKQHNISCTQTTLGIILDGIPVYLSYKPGCQTSKLGLMQKILDENQGIPCAYHCRETDKAHPQNAAELAFRESLLSKRVLLQSLNFSDLFRDLVAVSAEQGVNFIDRPKML